METTSTERMRRMRGHRNGDHSTCDYRRCDIRRELEDANENKLDALALFEELANYGIDPLTYLGDRFDEVKAQAERELPDYIEPHEPDWVNRRRAISEVKEFIAGIRRHEFHIAITDDGRYVRAEVKPDLDPIEHVNAPIW
jgi:hypothetical protein